MSSELKQLTNYLSQDAINELHGEGFPDYMIWSFIKTAEETKTIISSRLPGGVGTDLIEAGYDLKGFQVKAKSCDWGPMGGFICQLPFLNKKGYEKIGYNTGYISDYLDSLNKFSGDKDRIAVLSEALKEVSDFLSPIKHDANDVVNEILMAKVELTDDLGPLSLQFGSQILTNAEHNTILQILNTETRDIIKIRNEIYEIYNLKIGAIVTAYRAKELNIAKWSGENSIPPGLPTPFIQLKRRYDGNVGSVIQNFNEGKNGIKECADTGDGRITGIAFNDDTEEFSTIKIEFLLKLDTIQNVWAIYHGDIFYRSKIADIWTPYEFATYVITDAIWKALGVEAEKKDITAQDYIKGLNQIFFRDDANSVKVGQKTYYPLCGIMNPHPPYPQTINNNANPDFYKNAVSGDFDLFAFWPSSNISAFQLTRLSEKYLNTNFKFYLNADLLFCIEFIPGFGELTQRADVQALKESAEVGNISGLGGLVAGTLNNISMTCYKKQYAIDIGLSKAFHSDEGGRPGILEVEFPIAVFFPKPIKTAALNNLYTDAKTKTIPALNGRIAINTNGGLIKTPEEFLQVLIDSNSAKDKYQILMHSEWLIHLFYISMTKANRTAFRDQMDDFKAMFDMLKTTDANGQPIIGDVPRAAQAKMISKKIDEFATIEKNHVAIYPNDTNADSGFGQAAFELTFRNLLQLDVNIFQALRMQFLKMAFQGGKKAFARKREVETIIYAPDLV